MEQTYRIDAELSGIMPELSKEEYKELESSLLEDGFKGAPIIVWKQEGIIVDGHNRYGICKKHDIPYEVQELDFDSREDVIQWMIRAQLGRRNLSSLQKIEIAERFRPLFRKKAKENQSKAGKEYGNGGTKLTENLPQALDENIKKERNPTVNKELSEIAGVSEKTYTMGKKILDSQDEELIREVKAKEKSISGAYKELVSKDVPKSNDTIEFIDTTKRENKVEDNALSDMLSGIQKRYKEYLAVFQQDIKWLSAMEFYQNDEEVTGKVYSDLQNCLEKFKSISDMMQGMSIDEFGGISIEK